jgi:hypothetical protein
MEHEMNRAILSLLLLAACGGDRRYPFRDPMTRDTDMQSVWVRCHEKKDHKSTCAPQPYVTSLYWDGADNLIFRPLSDALSMRSSGESVNVNSLDEVPDSSWFTNRIEMLSAEDLKYGACKADQILDAEATPDGTWVIDKGKFDGSTPGFRIVVPGKGKFMLKIETTDDQPERQSAASKIGAAAFWAAGYNAECNQIVYVRPSLLKLSPGLRSRANFEPERPFDQKRLDELMSKSVKRDGKYRMSASAWMPGYNIGPYRYEGTRKDDPNDVIPHEDRRDLRGMRVLAAWLGRTDGREANSFDAWIADDTKKPESSPGKVIHYAFDESEVLGGDWPWAPREIAARLGSSYLIDWGDVARDFITFGAKVRPWEDLKPVRGHEIFGYYELDHFDPEKWKNEYPNVAWSRMTERDAAWMARILAHVTPEMIHTLAANGDFSDPAQTAYIEHVMEGRLERVLERWLMRLSPIGDLHIDGQNLCGVDMAELRAMRTPSEFRYAAHTKTASFAITRDPRGRICAALRHTGEPYMRIEMDDGVAKGKLVAHVYDLGDRGFKLVGVERPKP